MKGEKKAVDFISRLDDFHISIITLSELFYGIYNSKNKERHMKTLEYFLRNIPIIDMNFSIAHNFGIIKSRLKKKGRFTGEFDMLIASFALTYGFHLVTRNVKHYKEVPGIRIKEITS